MSCKPHRVVGWLVGWLVGPVDRTRSPQVDQTRSSANASIKTLLRVIYVSPFSSPQNQFLHKYKHDTYTRTPISVRINPYININTTHIHEHQFLFFSKS